MTKLDFKLTLKDLYQASAKGVTTVNVPAMNFLMIDGEGDPNTTPAYTEAIEALFAVSYAAKFLLKKGPAGIDYGVMPLEGLWWVDDMSRFSTQDKSNWLWTAMVMQPEVVSAELIERAIAESAAKKHLPALTRLRFECFEEGLCAQLLHVGPFSAEGPTIERVHEHIGQQGMLTGKHHEIYLSDIRRADPSKWKTIVRQPFVANAKIA